MAAFARGDWARARDLAERVASLAPRHGGVRYLAGTAALQMGQVDAGISHLQAAAQAEPARGEYRAQLARAWAMGNRIPRALAEADAALALPGLDPVSLDTLGAVFTRANAHRRAAEVYRRASELDPGHAGHHFNLAVSHMYLGDMDAAEREYEAAIAADPRCWRAYLGLAQLRQQTHEHNHLPLLEDALGRFQADDEARIHLHLALSKEQEDLGDYDRAFDHLVQGKAVHRRRIGDPAGRDAADAEALMRAFDESIADEPGHSTREPIFVLGMPRSGTTLVDRILSSHPQVHSAGELGNFGQALARISGLPARSLADVARNLGSGFRDWEALGRGYVDSTRPDTGRTPRFTDKLPHNFLFAGFIARALPQATILCLRRDPMDACLGNFRMLFAAENPIFDYSYDLLDVGRHYLAFERLMRHWHQAMPGRIVEVHYESLVDDQEGATRRILEACGLPWDPACLRFEESAIPVATASAVQVRSAMNRDSLHRWKRYGARLDPLRRLLEAGGIEIRG